MTIRITLPNWSVYGNLAAKLQQGCHKKFSSPEAENVVRRYSPLLANLWWTDCQSFTAILLVNQKLVRMQLYAKRAPQVWLVAKSSP